MTACDGGACAGALAQLPMPQPTLQPLRSSLARRPFGASRSADEVSASSCRLLSGSRVRLQLLGWRDQPFVALPSGREKHWRRFQSHPSD